MLAPPRELVPCRRSVDDDCRQENATEEVPHEDGGAEKDDAVDQKVVVLLREAVDDTDHSDQGDWNDHGEVDEEEAEVLEVQDIQGWKQDDGQGHHDDSADSHRVPPPLGGCLPEITV